MAQGQKSHDSAVSAYTNDLKAFVFVLFFAFGGITSLNDVLIPKLKALFTLSYRDVMLVQSAFFAAYFIVSIPAAALVRKIGYMRSAVVGLLTMTAGCLLFEPASAHGMFGLFLVALFVLASGITTVQVVANPLISRLGPPATASSRLTFAQAFNSLGTTIFPVCRFGSHPGIFRRHRSRDAIGSGSRRTSHQSNSHRCRDLPRIGGGPDGSGCRRLASPRCARRKTGGKHLYFAFLRSADTPAIRLRGPVHLFICRRGSRDRLGDRELPDARRCARDRRRTGRQARAVLLGYGDGRAIPRRLCACGYLGRERCWRPRPGARWCCCCCRP